MSPPAAASFRITGRQDFARHFAVSHETAERLECYVALIKQWQKVKNLVSEKTLDEIWHRHIADSAQLLRWAPSEARIWLDLGSGAGFPGLVLAIMLREQGESLVHLVEANGRKCAFLREVARTTRAPVEIHNQRIETLADSGKTFPVDLVTARALAPLDQLLGFFAGYQGAGTIGLFLKGQTVESEIEEADQSWFFDRQIIPSLTEPKGHIVKISRLEARS